MFLIVAVYCIELLLHLYFLNTTFTDAILKLPPCYINSDYFTNYQIFIVFEIVSLLLYYFLLLLIQFSNFPLAILILIISPIIVYQLLNIYNKYFLNTELIPKLLSIFIDTISKFFSCYINPYYFTIYGSLLSFYNKYFLSTKLTCELYSTFTDIIL